MTALEILKKELEELEDAIELASDSDRPAISLVPKYSIERDMLKRLIYIMEHNYDDY